jgi:hypothetical protein
MGPVERQSFSAGPWGLRDDSAPVEGRAKIKARIAGRYVIEWEAPAEYLRWAGGEVDTAEPGGEAFEISVERLVVGSKREGDVSVVLDEASVDERHGEFALDEKGQLIYKDFGTRYGSLLFILSGGGECANGAEEEPRELAHLTREGRLQFGFDESLLGRQLYLQVGQVETFLRVTRRD